MLGDYIIGVENRDGNAPVTFMQEEMYTLLKLTQLPQRILAGSQPLSAYKRTKMLFILFVAELRYI